ncbi:MAG: hypothetical protein HYT90_03915 [Candidatus Omnitrophica bacterium]|nr:hypothetical protein [Candidatus Omnitrophota bacterium]
MPDIGCLFLSLVCLIVGASFILFPHALLGASRALNRTLTVLDDRLIRHRYVMGLLLFAVSYALFRLSLLIPLSRG